MADGVDVARLNLLIELLTDFASVPDVDRLVSAFSARARFLVPFSRVVILLGGDIARPARVVVVPERGMSADVKVSELSVVEITLATQALKTMLPAVDELRHPRTASYPIASLGKPLGALIFTTDRTTYSMSDLRIVQALSEACAGVVARIEMASAFRRERAALAAVEVSEVQRRPLSRELHDEMGQELTALVLGLKLAGDSLVDSDLRARVQRLQAVAVKLSRDMHRIALELRPGALDDHGLKTALSNYVEEWSKRYDVGADFQSVGVGIERLPPHVETTIYRIVQEALTNVSKHAGATAVSVVLQRHSHEVVTIVEDDGCGFDAAAVEAATGLNGPIGLVGMRERAVLVGGTCHIESQSSGTSVFVRIPLSAGEGASGG